MTCCPAVCFCATELSLTGKQGRYSRAACFVTMAGRLAHFGAHIHRWCSCHQAHGSSHAATAKACMWVASATAAAQASGTVWSASADALSALLHLCPCTPEMKAQGWAQCQAHAALHRHMPATTYCWPSSRNVLSENVCRHPARHTFPSAAHCVSICQHHSTVLQAQARQSTTSHAHKIPTVLSRYGATTAQLASAVRHGRMCCATNCSSS